MPKKNNYIFRKYFEPMPLSLIHSHGNTGLVDNTAVDTGLLPPHPALVSVPNIVAEDIAEKIGIEYENMQQLDAGDTVCFIHNNDIGGLEVRTHTIIRTARTMIMTREIDAPRNSNYEYRWRFDLAPQVVLVCADGLPYPYLRDCPYVVDDKNNILSNTFERHFNNLKAYRAAAQNFEKNIWPTLG